MEIKSAEFVISNAKASACPKGDLPEYAFVGRSNVGKSSLINMLTNRKNLAKTSSTPGKTLLINHFLINENWYVVDLPGYGFAKRSKKEQDGLTSLINDYILDRKQMQNLFLLIDSRLKPQPIDLKFIEFLGENNIPFALVFTKSDKLGPGKARDNVNSYLKNLGEQWEELPPHFTTSAEKSMGRKEILDYIEQINKNYNEK
jgi:GTP-binding protein